MKIGLLGGSFNPAHAGHFHISQQVRKRLELDEVWWLVSPQNPLKTRDDMADYATRVASARRFAHKNSWLKICEIEQENNLQYTADTLELLLDSHPKNQFVWIMGSDNLHQFHRWKNWRNILNSIAICVVDRTPHSHAALRSPAAIAYAQHRLPSAHARHLIDAPTPRWTYLFIPRHKQSATNLRNKFGKNAFLQ